MQMQTIPKEPVAIVGIGCRFPGAKCPQAFWKLLHEGRDATREVPKQRWNIEQLYDPDPSKAGYMSSRRGGFIDQIDQFDWKAFRIPPREARYMDPQHRLLLEVSWEALEDAGIPFAQLIGSRTSVFTGITWNDYLRLQTRDWSQLNGYTATGNAFGFAANRLSYFFGLKGPSASLDAGCTSSLMSTYLACQSLWSGEATLAIAGGVNLLVAPDSSIIASKAGLLSAKGECRPLDADADGILRGEGAGVIVLKLLSQTDTSDRIYAVIRSIEVNHNGHNEWIMASNAEAQVELLRNAYDKAGLDLSEVDYIELHGTGFIRGDAIETKALGAAIKDSCDKRLFPCLIGSVKANIGHLEAAAGIASLIKVALSLYHQQIPPTINFERINPDIHLDELHLAVAQQLCSWPSKQGTSCAGVTTLSLTGANAHAVLTRIPTPRRPSEHHDYDQILPLSARSLESLRNQVASFRDFLASSKEEANAWNDICYTAQVRRTHHNYRVAVLASTVQEAASYLDGFLQNQFSPKLITERSETTRKQKIAFLFTDPELSDIRIQEGLFKRWSLIQKTLESCAQQFPRWCEYKRLPALKPTSFFERIDDGKVARIRNAMRQIAFAMLWQDWNIVPDVIIGDGVSEIIAAHSVGTLPLKKALDQVISAFSQKSDSPFQAHSKSLYLERMNSLEVPNTDGWKGQMLPFSEINEKLINVVFDKIFHFGNSESLLQEKFSPIRNKIVNIFSLSETDILTLLGTFYVGGHEINWRNFETNEGKCVSLPTYQWQREPLWLDWLSVEEISTSPK